MYFFLQNDYIKNRLKNFIFSVSQYSYLKKFVPTKQKHEYHSQKKGYSSKTPNPFQKTDILCIYMCIKKTDTIFKKPWAFSKYLLRFFKFLAKWY